MSGDVIMIKCPKCDKAIDNVKIHSIAGVTQTDKQAKCTAYTCPSCNTMISVSIDPLALNANLMARMKNLLGRK
jgi:hypothetical protein